MTWEQTADVLAKEVARLQKENDRLRGGIQEGVKRLAYIPYFSALHLIFDSAKMVHNDLETLVSPAAEGGGAANGGESEALQAAIMGLHGMAKEFPNPMWKTREDYLAATISEINEILGK